jgi:lipoate-protein ligase A
VYGDAFSLLDRDASRVPKSRVTELTRNSEAQFALTDNDYVIGNQKIAGNAQAITKDRWLHHTSFLWDFRQQRMDMLREPERRPKYRGARKHASFLCPLITLGYKRQDFLESIEDAFAARGYDMQLAELSDVEPFLDKPHLKTSRMLDYDLLLQKPVSED